MSTAAAGAFFLLLEETSRSLAVLLCGCCCTCSSAAACVQVLYCTGIILYGTVLYSPVDCMNTVLYHTAYSTPAQHRYTGTVPCTVFCTVPALSFRQILRYSTYCAVSCRVFLYHIQYHIIWYRYIPVLSYCTVLYPCCTHTVLNSALHDTVRTQHCTPTL